jgi:hypothetical protein
MEYQIMENPPMADLFTGRMLDILDKGSLKVQHGRRGKRKREN